MKGTKRTQKFIFTADQQALAFQKAGSAKGCLLLFLPRASLEQAENYAKKWIPLTRTAQIIERKRSR